MAGTTPYALNLLMLFLDCFFVPEGTLMGRKMDILRAWLSSMFGAPR